MKRALAIALTMALLITSTIFTVHAADGAIAEIGVDQEIIELGADVNVTGTSASCVKTQAEAVAWLNAQEGQRYDVDGAYGSQCSDFSSAYVNYVLTGDPYGGRIGVYNASEYSNAGLYPNDWQVFQNTASFVPEPGDIFVVNGTTGYGHTGVVISSTVNDATIADQNGMGDWNLDYGSPAHIHNITWSSSGTWAPLYFIRPNFNSPHTHSYGAWQTVKAATCTTAGSKKRVCSCGDTQTETIPATGHKWNSGVVTTQPTCENKGVKTFTCSSCNTTRTEDVAALGHQYEAVTVPATCTDAAYTKYTCSRCGNTYNEPIDGWSEWSTTTPPANAKETQQKTQYRYRTKETSTGSDPEKAGWTTDSNGATWQQTSSGTHAYFSRPNGFNSSEYTNYSSSAISSYSNTTTKRDVSSASHRSYIYWHWAYPYTYGNGGNTIIGDFYGDTWQNYEGSATVWEAFESSGDVTERTNSDGTVVVQGHSSYSYNWFKTEVYQQTYTDYAKQYSYYRWSDWSAWQDDSVTASSDKQVEQRTVYRYLSDDNNATGHQFGTTWKYDAEGHWQECSVCGVKSESESHIFDNDQDATCNICGYIRTVEVDPVIDPDDAHLVIGSKTARAGDTVKISFELKNAPQLKSIAVSGITYDHSALELVNGEWKITDSILSNWNSANQTAAIAFAENKDVNGCIFELTFKVKDGTEDGDYSVGCKITAKTKTASGAEEAVAIPAQKGTVSVISVIRGDVNDDNEVTSDDAIQVLYYTLLPDIYTVNQEVDFNGDGMITSDDAVYLLYFTLLPDLYPLH